MHQNIIQNKKETSGVLIWLLSYLLIWREPGLKIGNHILIQLEGLCENTRIDWWVWAKDCILAAEISEGNSLNFSYIELEVNQTNWENKNISRV